ncbi:MAG: hypothetical protein ACTIJA_08265 [Bavariicoccus seileri]|uniref:hypothetical protein n=1 Tax=Bavariicoccus seileri TaxID=549685 RepID=UPI0003B4C4E6|nr:hypothetical protein [Bavariicoccus seileri]
MVDKKKALIIGLGATLIIGAAAAIIASDEEKRESVSAFINRQKVKCFVKDKLNGNEKALNAVDELSDADVNRLVAIVEKTGDWKENFLEAFSEVKDKTKDVLKRDEDWLSLLSKLSDKYLK